MNEHATASGQTHSTSAPCAECWQRDRCLLNRLATRHAGTLRPQRMDAPLARAATLVREGERATDLYVIRSGSAKSSTRGEDGNEHIRDFHLPGDVVGLESMCSRDYSASVAMLERSGVCQLEGGPDWAGLDDADFDDLRRAYALELERLRRARRALHEHDATRRVELFLEDYRDKVLASGLAADLLMLKMSRFDIASYLHLAPETVSRKFTQMQAAGRIELRGKSLRMHVPGTLAMQAAPRSA